MGRQRHKGPRKNSKTLDAIRKCFEQYQPDVVVIENIAEKGARRAVRIRRLYRSVARFAQKKDIALYGYSRQAVRAAFSPLGAAAKYEIAQAVTLRIPAFTHRAPRARKLWKSEDPRQSLFDALALALALAIVFYEQQKFAWYSRRSQDRGLATK